jgi:hypothetical protein
MSLAPEFLSSRDIDSNSRPGGVESDLDVQFRRLWEESARTLMLMRALREAPFYRYASADPRFGDGH